MSFHQALEVRVPLREPNREPIHQTLKIVFIEIIPDHGPRPGESGTLIGRPGKFRRALLADSWTSVHMVNRQTEIPPVPPQKTALLLADRGKSVVVVAEERRLAVPNDRQDAQGAAPNFA